MEKYLKKINVFIKYIGSGGLCYIVDITLFALLSLLLQNIFSINYILISTICARLVSSIINFILNKNKVFNNQNSKPKNTLDLTLNYTLLVLIQMFMSAILAEITFKLIGFSLVLIKFIVDCVIFIVNYFIQKKYIFNNKYIRFESIIKNILCYIKENKLICIILLISLALHIGAFITLGFNYNLESDDTSYIESGIYFKNNLSIIMHGVQSAQIMPGMTYLIALISYFFGEGLTLIIALKIIWMLMGLLSILGVYKITRLFSNKFFSALAASLMLAIDFVWMDNIILTETPFMFGFIFLIYSSIMLGKTQNKKYFCQIIIFYMFCLLLKANIAPYPIFLILYLLLKKYNTKLLLKQMLIAGIVLSMFFIPWIIRNYIVFDRFIPLTYGGGNPLLLGTYQGYDFPEDDEEAYNKYIEENYDEYDIMNKYLNDEMTEKLYMKKYYSLEKDGLIAKYRMKQWWNNNKISMLKSYLIYKPSVNIYNTFYWEEVFNIPGTFILKLRKIDIILTIICGISILLSRKHFKELLFLTVNYVFQIAVYSYTFAFDRYGQTLLFIRFIIIGIGLQVIYDFIKKIYKQCTLKFNIKQKGNTIKEKKGVIK